MDAFFELPLSFSEATLVAIAVRIVSVDVLPGVEAIIFSP